MDISGRFYIKTMAARYVFGNTMFVVAPPDTYDHRTLKTRLPVRSALFKQRTGGLVVRWVTTSEYPLLYVFAFLLLRSVNSYCSQSDGESSPMDA